LQKELKNVVKNDFEFCSTRNGTMVITKGIGGFEAVKSHFTNNNLSYYSYFPKSQKPVKAVIRHLPPNNPQRTFMKDWCPWALTLLASSTRRSPSDETTAIPLPLFFITLPRTEKSQEIFNLPRICHISLKVKAYRAQTGLTQCHKCRELGHVWANWRRERKHIPPITRVADTQRKSGIN
jgi:hypothetical protein